MNIVCVAACTAGIAHTYIAREKLIKGAKALGHTIKVETQGTIGTENELQAAEISAACNSFSVPMVPWVSTLMVWPSAFAPLINFSRAI